MASSPCFISCPPDFVFCGFWRSITRTNRIFWFWFFIPDNQPLWHESPHLLFIEREISQKLFRSLRCSCRSIWLIPYPSRGVQLGCGYSQGQVMTKSKCQLLINRVRAAFQSWAHWLAPSVNGHARSRVSVQFGGGFTAQPVMLSCLSVQIDAHRTPFHFWA